MIKKLPFIQKFSATLALLALLIMPGMVWGQGTEYFTNLPSTSSSSYLSRSWTGDNSVIWTAEGARTDQTINGKAICWGNSGTRNVISPTYSGGMGTLTFNYVRAFTGTSARTIQVWINGTQIGSNITVSPTSDVVAQYSEVINVSGNVVLEIRSTGAAQVKVDDISWTAYSSGANLPPDITGIVITPSSGIVSTTAVSVSAEVTDSDGTVEGVELHWGTSSGSPENTINMTLGDGNTYTTDSDIPAQTGGTTVYYEIYAIDDDADETTSTERNYYVAIGEPTNHATLFTAEANSSSQITITWEDATGGQLPGAYLVKASIDPATPAVPSDGVAEVDGALVKNVLHGGTQQAVFTGLDALTKYNFSIWPYTNSGININYKTGDPVPVADATTSEAASIKWDGGASTSSWEDANNWSNNIVPSTNDLVFLDNELVVGSYAVILPSGNVKTAIKRLTISPDASNTITITLPAGNTFGASNDAGFVVGDNLPSTDDIIINSGGILVNSSGATAGNGIQVNSLTNGTLRINNGGKFVHNTTRSAAGTSAAVILSTAVGTENGIYEYDVPGTASYAIGASGRTYGTLILTRSGGAATYASSGSSALTVNGNLIFNSGVTYTTTMTGALNVAGNLTNNGTTLSIPSGQAVNFNGSAMQEISGISNNIFGGDVVISSTSDVHLNSGIGVTVSGTLTTNNALTLENGASLITNGVLTGEATVKRSITAEQYHYISSPVQTTTAGVVFPLSTFLRKYDETSATAQWVNLLAADALIPVKGYSAFIPAATGNTTVDYTGALNTGNQSIAGLTYTTNSTPDYDGYNLVGNPYPSAIDIDNAGVTLTNLTNTFYFWNPALNGSLGAYATWTKGTPGSGTNSATKYIPVGQGFFVQTTAVDGALNLSNAARVHNSQAFYKNSEDNVLRMKLEGGIYSDEAVIRYQTEATPERDAAFDAIKLKTAAVNNLYTKSADGLDLAMNTYKDISQTPEILVYAEIAAAGNYTLSFSGIETLTGVGALYLTDLLTQVTQNLSENPVYNFTANTSDNANRFKLSFSEVGINETPALNIGIYAAGNEIRLQLPEIMEGTVRITTLDGRILNNTSFNGTGEVAVRTNVSGGVYLVTVITEKGTISRKVLVK